LSIPEEVETTSPDTIAVVGGVTTVRLLRSSAHAHLPNVAINIVLESYHSISNTGVFAGHSFVVDHDCPPFSL
jgi:hypothetical protein